MITLEQFREFEKKNPKGCLYAIDGNFGIVELFPTAYVIKHYANGTEKREVEGVTAVLPFIETEDFLTHDVFLTHEQALNDLGARFADVKYELKEPDKEE